MILPFDNAIFWLFAFLCAPDMTIILLIHSPPPLVSVRIISYLFINLSFSIDASTATGILLRAALHKMQPVGRM